MGDAEKRLYLKGWGDGALCMAALNAEVRNPCLRGLYEDLLDEWYQIRMAYKSDAEREQEQRDGGGDG